MVRLLLVLNCRVFVNGDILLQVQLGLIIENINLNKLDIINFCYSYNLQLLKNVLFDNVFNKFNNLINPKLLLYKILPS